MSILWVREANLWFSRARNCVKNMACYALIVCGLGSYGGKSMIKLLRLAAVLAMAGTAASASSYTLDFTSDIADGEGSTWSGTETMLKYSNIGGSGIDVKLTTTGGNGKIETWGHHGLGAPTDSHHQVDSKGIPETINLDFSHDVKITKITFNYVHWWDDFELSDSNGSIGVFDVMSSTVVATGHDSHFGIGAVGYEVFETYSALHNYSSKACYKLSYRYDQNWRKVYKEKCYSAFKITSVMFEKDRTPVIPLPASSLLLLGGLGGIAALRRRK